MAVYKGMAICVYCKKKMLNYQIKYADIIYKLCFCWGPNCHGYFEMTPKIHTELTDAFQDNPLLIHDLLAQKALKPIL